MALEEAKLKGEEDIRVLQAKIEVRVRVREVEGEGGYMDANGKDRGKTTLSLSLSLSIKKNLFTKGFNNFSYLFTDICRCKL
jgi:hypothetical protein